MEKKQVRHQLHKPHINTGVNGKCDRTDYGLARYNNEIHKIIVIRMNDTKMDEKKNIIKLISLERETYFFIGRAAGFYFYFRVFFFRRIILNSERDALLINFVSCATMHDDANKFPFFVFFCPSVAFIFFSLSYHLCLCASLFTALAFV